MNQTVSFTHEIFDKDEILNVGAEVFQGDKGTLKIEVSFTQGGQAATLTGYTLSIVNCAPNKRLRGYVADGSTGAAAVVSGSTVTWTLGAFDAQEKGTYTAQIRLSSTSEVVTVVFVRYNVEASVAGQEAGIQAVFPTYEEMLEKAKEVIPFVDAMKEIVEDNGVTWNTLVGKPETFPPSTHSHSDLSALISGNAASIATLETEKADVSQVVEATFTADGWVGTAAPYTQAVTVTGITATTNALIDYTHSTTAATEAESKKAWGCISFFEQAADTITAQCLDKKPSTALAVRVMIVG